jgi:hypothetical protein
MRLVFLDTTVQSTGRAAPASRGRQGFDMAETEVVDGVPKFWAMRCPFASRSLLEDGTTTQTNVSRIPEAGNACRRLAVVTAGQESNDGHHWAETEEPDVLQWSGHVAGRRLE